MSSWIVLRAQARCHAGARLGSLGSGEILQKAENILDNSALPISLQ